MEYLGFIYCFYILKKNRPKNTKNLLNTKKILIF